jgi:ferrochelatase
VRRFLGRLLGDPRVVDLPRWLWLPLLHAVILRVRPKRSAAKYRAIWTPAGSPLQVESEALRRRLADALQMPVTLGMLYGGKTVAAAYRELLAVSCERIVVLPMFPQYCGASTGAVTDQVEEAVAGDSRRPSLAVVSNYHLEPGYLEALAESVEEHRGQHEGSGHLMMSFHGIPQRYVQQGDPYRGQCEATAAALAARLGLSPDRWSLSFQSRFGRAKWLQPYTSEVLAAMPARGIRNVSVICPGFAADCLETLEEIGMENRDIFLGAGGEAYHYIPALNARPAHVTALASVIRREVRCSG